MAQKTSNLKYVLTGMRSAVSSSGEAPSKFLGRLADVIEGVNLSIRVKILIALSIVILIMGATNALLVVQMLNYGRQYDAIITNITTANSISGNVKPEIDGEMWSIVSGQMAFKDGKQ